MSDPAPLPPSQTPPAPPVSQGAKPDNSLILAIFSTLCCCVPTGIAAIVFAAQVDGKWATGDIAGAREAADRARMWSWISIGLGVVGGLVYLALGGFASLASSAQY